MTQGPLQPIPESTQPHVDRLIGAQVDGYRLTQRFAEGRFGTLYLAEPAQGGKAVLVEVLRTELVSHDEEARAVDALKRPGVVPVKAFGQLPDGRRYRVMDLFDGESLDQRLERAGPLRPAEVVRLLAQVATVLEGPHAWAMAHGGLGPSTVFVAGDGVKLIDFGLSKHPVKPEDDLVALGRLGFTLLTGRELLDGAPPPLGTGIPELLDRLLRELMEKRLATASAARRELEAFDAAPASATQPGAAGVSAVQGRATGFNATDSSASGAAARATAYGAAAASGAGVGAAPRRRTLPLVIGLAALAAAGGVAAFATLDAPGDAAPAPLDAPAALGVDEEDFDIPEPAEEAAAAESPAANDEPAANSTSTAPRPPSKVRKPARRVPSVAALNAEIARLEARLLKQARPGEDLDQPMYVLNKQRLRLTGAPTEQDRVDVARQLKGWRRSYLRP